MGWRDRLQATLAEQLTQTAQLTSEKDPQIEAEAAQIAADLAGLRQAALQHPTSWADPAARPTPGCWCSCCGLGHWWMEATGPRGWRCITCHPHPPSSHGEVLTIKTQMKGAF